MNHSKRKKGWIDPAWRYIRLIMLLWGVGQAAWLYFRMDSLSIFTSLLFILLLIGSWAIKLESRSKK